MKRGRTPFCPALRHIGLGDRKVFSTHFKERRIIVEGKGSVSGLWGESVQVSRGIIVATMTQDRLPQLLICDDDSTFQLALKTFLKGKFQCRTAYNADEAAVILRNHPVDVLLLDVQMRSHDEGLKAIPKLLAIDPAVAIVMSSGVTDFNVVREAMKLGAVDYVVKGDDPNALALTLQQVMDRKRLVERKLQQNSEVVLVQKQHSLVGKSPAIQNLRKLIERIRLSPANVVITGETGTGKEVVARQLRKTLADGSLEPFIAVDSSTIQSSTAESQLFGYEKGAFTGADKSTRGIFEEANGGVVYFDELGNMPLEIQAKLLRVLQEKEVMRMGSSKPIQLEFRVICATNKNLEQMVRAGQFKDDLLQRVKVLPIQLPALRERREDVPELVEHFLSRQGDHGRLLRFTAEALEVLQAYPWPGNIRELGNVVAYVAAMTEGDEVDVADLPPQFRDNFPPPAELGLDAVTAGDFAGMSFYEQVSSFERKILTDAYGRSGGNMSRLAMTLRMDRSHLYRKLKEHNIHQPRPVAPRGGSGGSPDLWSGNHTTL